jgi:hypothetical protein
MTRITAHEAPSTHSLVAALIGSTALSLSDEDNQNSTAREGIELQATGLIIVPHSIRSFHNYGTSRVGATPLRNAHANNHPKNLVWRFTLVEGAFVSRLTSNWLAKTTDDTPL